MRPELVLRLNRFKPRAYQLPIAKALEVDGFKKILCIMPRRSGKDILAWNLMIRAALKKVGVYFYCLPTFRQAKLVIWDSITNSGERFIDYIPKELIAQSNSQEMKIRLTNGSLIQLIGSDTYDTSLIGTNPRMIIFSEWALSDSRAYSYVRPILNANDGTVMFLSTPRGKNHMWELYQIASQLDDWFVYKLTVEDTKHISLHDIEREIASGEISRDLALQEYWCSFEMGVEGAYYAKYLDKLRVAGQIGDVPWEPAFNVHTAWDLGMRDSTTIIFFQTIGQTVRIIDCYENSKEGLEHYVQVLQSKPYVYGKHIGPHDIKVTELGTGMSRLEKMRQLGLSFVVAPNIAIPDGIEAVRSALPRMWFDQHNCQPLLKALDNYHQEYDHKKKVYKPRPTHDWSSHYSDSMRYLCVSLPKTRRGTTPEELDARYREAMYGNQHNIPHFFR